MLNNRKILIPYTSFSLMLEDMYGTLRSTLNKFKHVQAFRKPTDL